MTKFNTFAAAALIALAAAAPAFAEGEGTYVASQTANIQVAKGAVNGSYNDGDSRTLVPAATASVDQGVAQGPSATAFSFNDFGNGNG